jgi:hypothetical protein
LYQAINLTNGINTHNSFRRNDEKRCEEHQFPIRLLQLLFTVLCKLQKKTT